eukprot:gnl/TRDRNA2_/TRDRNA2_190437_c0_seq1.p1 gnl/TRDRNA2_/TRDRNA2_190437_c0~~gnl/TRDRNA2_/TRDRNA2_190437_c0_seq1.p1  ORF type:complete len:193 (-),score=12.64 gnl/TRDRNA2_/TRDRNA2_190437_c0_seq1:351-929(-)
MAVGKEVDMTANKYSFKDTWAVILAGGRSARMGTDKATTLFHGKSLLDHTLKLTAELGLSGVTVLGREQNPRGKERFPGPARTIVHWLKEQEYPVDLLVLPVDMPALSLAPLAHLMKEGNGAFYDDLYLPFFAPNAVFSPKMEEVARMRELLAILRLGAIPVPDRWKIELTGVNTPQELIALEVVTKLNIRD